MITEVGSVYPLDTLELKPTDILTVDELKKHLSIVGDFVLLSLGREGFSIVARKHSEVKRVLLPKYTCQTVCDPFVELGWEIDTYTIDKSLRIDINDIKYHVESFKPTVIVVHPFYGTSFTFEETETIKEIKDKGIIVVADYTQSIYCKDHLDFADYVVASLRKWFDCPDGGYIYSTNHKLTDYYNLSENTVFVVPQTDSMYLRDSYFKTGNQSLKDISIRLNKQAVSGADKNIQPHALSKFGLNRLLNSELEAFAAVRFSNYKYLYNHINQNNVIKFVYTSLDSIVSSPLYFPIYCKNRSALQKLLAENKVYAPVLWSVPECYKNLDEISQYIYEHILVIPIDQRYGESEMRRISEIINCFSINK